MANQFLTTAEILFESLLVLKNNLELTRHIGRQYSTQFGVAGAKVGATVNARKPPKYRGRYGNALDPEDIVETPVPIVCDNLFGVDLEYTDVDLTLTMDNFRKRYIEPAVCRIANEVDKTAAAQYVNIYNFVGVPGTVPTDDEQYLNAGVKLDNTGTPRRGKFIRSMILSSQSQATLVHGLKGLFQKSDSIARQYEEGEMGTALGWNFSMDQNIPTHVVGALGGTPLVIGAGQTGASILTDGWTASISGVLKQGDCITFANVYGITPQTADATGGGTSTGQLQQFVVTADVDSDGTGAATVPISPSIVTSGAFQTVTVSPADNAVILIFTSASAYAAVSTKQNLGFHKDCFTLVTVDLEDVGGVDMMGRISDADIGLAMRLVRAYDIRTNTRPTRLEMLWGNSTIYPEMGVRVQS